MPKDTEQPSSPTNPSPQLSPDTEIERLKRAIADLQARVAVLEQGAVPIAQNNREATESRFGLTIVNRIGAVTLAAGIVFFFKYAADNHWIGAGELVLLGLLAGAVLVGAGDWLRGRKEQAFAQGLAGCGFAILYISVYAAVGYYKLIPRGAGFGGMLIAAVLAIAFCFRFVSPAIAAVGFIGAWIAPLLLRGQPNITQSLLDWVYLFLLSVLAIVVVERLYRRVLHKAALLLFPFNAFWALFAGWLLLKGEHALLFISFAFALAALHFILAVFYRAMEITFRTLYLIGHTCFAVAGLRVLDVWTIDMATPENRINVLSELDSLFLALYGVVVIALGVLRKSVLNRVLGLVLLGIVVVKLYLYDVWLLTRIYRISAFVALGVLLLVASYAYSRFKSV